MPELPNLHPPLVAFPLSFITLLFLLEWYSLISPAKDYRQVTKILLTAVLVFTLFAFFSGYQASEVADMSFKVPDDAIDVHHQSGKLLLFATIPMTLMGLLKGKVKYNQKIFMVTYFLLLTLCQVLVLYTGYLGGQLVFRHGAGVYAEVSAAD
ncbi:MAG: hypothetical protein D6719_03190 [Candidatus Dadabacteria bacterium]|nr:MAG: hypothetical protein D6719_03190 [Candidatus Dadabacteria bacterium]